MPSLSPDSLAPLTWQSAAVVAIGHLSAHAPLTALTLSKLQLLPRLLECAKGKRRLGRAPALELKTKSLQALAQLAVCHRCGLERPSRSRVLPPPLRLRLLLAA